MITTKDLCYFVGNIVEQLCYAINRNDSLTSSIVLSDTNNY